MSDYAALVERYRTKRLDRLITNDSIANANVLFSNLFEHAKEPVAGEPRVIRIESQRCQKDFYAGFAAVAAQLMRDGTEIRVLLHECEGDLSSNPFLREVEKSPRGEIRLLNDDVPRVENCLLVGTSAFRYEYDLAEYQAVANFNDPLVGEDLVKRFDRQWERARRIDGPDMTSPG